MHIPSLISASAALSIGTPARSSLHVDNAPDHVRPYVIERYANAQAVAVGQQIYRFPVTGASSGGAFSILMTNSPASDALGVLPHIHRTHYENFFCSKGRFQLWTQKNGDEEARVMLPGDYGAVPQNTTHTFQVLDPDTEMLGVIQPGGFEALFFAIADSNYTSSTSSPYVPSSGSGAADAGAGSSASMISALESFDVFAQLDFSPRRDLVNGSAPANATWHTGKNTPATNSQTPFYVAKNQGPMYLNSEHGYQIIAPFVASTQSSGAFAEGTITMSRHLSNTTIPVRSFRQHMAFEILEGALMVSMQGEQVQLLQGDVVFIPGNTSFSYWSEVAFTKFLYVGAGARGLDRALMDKSVEWEYPTWPTFAV
ncbi:RmlC-like cupin [Aureobasidium sp. EXF-10727]|nr:RmlC-like cupin [Aureobasidium sp. EXF-10727]